ncbi:amino acid-binding protein [Haladaptatus caseinilyticus]|uniref:amino acid-binding protein n=1 Tax=Haladaptatus caseinilyticus TaxID=2993314 RepID=UPI00224B738B|nr:amino acid-binding protein [Haladaptatus caseinilyticus]
MTDIQTEVQTYTIRLELIDDPGELLRALEPIANNGGNLLSVFHERGNITPRGHIPIEVDLEATAERYDAIIDSLRDVGIKVVQAGTERYSTSVTVILSGHLVDTDLSDTLTQIREKSNTSVTELSLSAPKGTKDISSARLQLATASGEIEETMEVVRTVAADKDLRVIEPLSLDSEI